MRGNARDLSVRMRGEDVAELQQRLLDLGYRIPESEVERRYFGTATRQAVEDVQHRHQIDVTGVVDPDTGKVLASGLDASETRPLVRLIDAESGLPLAGVSVRIEWPSNGREEVETSGPDGAVALHNGRVDGNLPAGEGSVLLEVLGASGELLQKVELALEPGEPAVPDVPVAGVRPGEQPIEDFAARVGLDLPRDLLSRLRRRRIRSLDDIRSAGGLEARSDGDGVLALLDAHAGLGVLPTDPSVNAKLIEAGYRSVLDIARAPREEFVESLSGELGSTDAAAVHDAATAERAFLANVATATRVGGAPVASASSAIQAATGQPCACEDCTNALSPLAYLADLLDYSIDHLRKTRGLRGSYFGQTTFTDLRLTRTDPRLDFDWGADSPDPLVNPDRFAVRWTGQLEPRFSETYTFQTVADGAIRVWIGNQLMIDDWQDHGHATNSGTQTLTAGRRYDLRVEYFDTSGNAGARLSWSSQSQPVEVIPQERLWPESGGLEVTLSLLEQLFHQPLRRLPAACRLVDERVRQVRICIEVLRGHVAANPPGAAGANYLQIAERDYLTSSYLKLLEEIGTSYDELAEARAAPRHVRVELGRRLGIDLDPQRGPNHPDELDQLVLEGAAPATVTENKLEYLFGLRDTRRDPLDTTPDGAILVWRQRHLRRVWKQEDWPANPPAGARPLIDPDLVGPDDFKSLTSAAFSLWQQRQSWLRSRLDDKYNVYTTNGLETVFTGPPSPYREIEDAQTGVVWLGIDFADIEAIRADQEQHRDVRAQLAALRLNEETFGQIARLVELFQTGTTALEPELSNVFSILVELEKEEMFEGWRTEERQAGITLSPDYFRLRPATADAGKPEDSLNPWRASRAERRRWERTLRARVEQEQAVLDGMREALDAAETAPLGLTRLRDGLVLAVAPAAGDLEARADWVTRRLLIDARAGICQMTTRVAEAIETLQGLLFAARNGLLEDDYLSLDAPAFDDEWRWIGSYASWRSAMLVFLYPETMLRPTLRRRRTRAFDDMVAALRDEGPATAELGRALAAVYSDYFADVCSLTRVGYCVTAGQLGTAAGSGPSTPSVLALARGGNTRRFYYSTYPRTPGWDVKGHPDQTLWEPVNGLPVTSRITSLLAYQPARGKAAVALFAYDEQTDKPFFASFDGSKRVAPEEITEVPGLVRASEVGDGVVAVDPALAGSGLDPWPLAGSELLAPLDLDGDRRREIVLIAASAGVGLPRRVGVLRERGGGLVVAGHGSLPAGWETPPGKPIVLGAYDQARLTERLLVVNRGTKQLGMLGLDPGRGEVGLVWTSGTAIGGWPVNPDALFIAADLDGDAQTELLAFEHAGDLDQLTAVTTATVLRVSSSGMTLRSTQQLTTGEQHPSTGAPIEDHWFPRAAPRASVRQDVLAYSDHTYAYSAPGERHGSVGVLRWDGFNQRLGFVAKYIGEKSLAGWEWHSDDRFLSFDADNDLGFQEVLVSSPSRPPDPQTPARPDVAVLIRPADGISLTTGWGATGTIAALGTGAAAVSFARAKEDQFVAADVDGDGRDEIVAVGPDASGALRAAVLEGSPKVDDWRSGAGQLGVAWSTSGKVKPPGGKSGEGWRLGTGHRYVSADVDGDGCDEIAVLSPDGALALLRGIPALRTAGLPERLGPKGVTVVDVAEKHSAQQLAARRTQMEAAYQTNLAFPGAPPTGWNLSYLDEAYYFVPMELAIRLAEAGDYGGALDWFSSVYDYGAPLADRKVAYNLRLEEKVSFAFERAPDWLTDPLNPHLIAATRAGSYTRFTILAIVRCLLDFADAEFTRATAESIPRARALYLAALELLDAPELRLGDTRCQDLIDGLEIDVGSGEWQPIWDQIRADLLRISDYRALSSVVRKIAAANGTDENIAERTAKARQAVDKALRRSSDAPTFEALLDAQAAHEESVTAALLVDREVAAAAARVGASTIRRRSELGDGQTPLDRESGRYPGHEPIHEVDGTADSGPAHLSPLGTYRYVPAPEFHFCVPPDPTVEAARQHAELSLRKIRSCRNIAGLPHHPEPYAEQTIVQVAGDGVADGGGLQPLPFRYGVLVERAKQLVDLARQIESSMLTAIEKGDEETYRKLRARQDLQLARAGVKLKDLQLAEAAGGVQLAAEQRGRAQLQEEHYSRLLSEGLSGWEIAGVAALQTAAALEAAGLYSADTLLEFAGAGAKVASAQAEVFNAAASYERRAQEWDAQKRLASQDVRVGEQQIELAREHVGVVSQDRAIAVLGADNAEAGLEFLARKFTNSDLYEWMSGVLEGVYRFFLRQATSMAQLAQAQLGFERQEVIPSFIQADYWEPIQTAAGESQETADERRGLTGSARLLRDIYQLDQYAFQTDQRKLQLSKTLSLAEMDPYAFQRFRETGLLVFETPLGMFDRDFPGHLLRLIKRVRTSVIALVPPVEGIKATLSTTGTSRVVLRTAGFPKVAVQRGPESVALTSPVRATGLFDLDAQPEMLVPFEGIGVEAAWELRMPKAANRIDYSTVADVLLTIDYTAIDSSDYRAELIGELDRTISAERTFSFRHVLQDQWYDLHNPDQTATPMQVTFRVSSADFPPNLLDDIEIAAVTVYYAQAAGASTAGWDVDLRTQLTYLPDQATAALDGSAGPSGGLASTRLARGSDWIKFVGELATGEWTLALPDTADTRALFDNDQVEDILFIVTYTATTPPWPED